MYKKVDASLNFLDREKEVLKFWDEEKVFEKSIKNTEGGQEFTFYDGPQAAYRSRFNARYERHFPALQNDEGHACSPQSRLGHARASRGA